MAEYWSERAAGVVGEGPGERRAQTGDVEQLGRGQAAGKRHHAGLLGQREDVADRRAGRAGDRAGCWNGVIAVGHRSS